MKLRLPNDIVSPQDLAGLILEVKDYARWSSHTSVKYRLGLKRAPQPPELSHVAQELIKLFAGSSAKPLNTKQADQVLNHLEQLKAAAPSIVVALAAPPTPGIQKTLTGWFRDNISPSVLITFQFNSALLGGMTVRYGSHVADWSFRKQIMDERQRFPEVLCNA